MIFKVLTVAVCGVEKYITITSLPYNDSYSYDKLN